MTHTRGSSMEFTNSTNIIHCFRGVGDTIQPYFNQTPYKSMTLTWTLNLKLNWNSKGLSNPNFEPFGVQRLLWAKTYMWVLLFAHHLGVEELTLYSNNLELDDVSLVLFFSFPLSIWFPSSLQFRVHQLSPFLNLHLPSSFLCPRARATHWRNQSSFLFLFIFGFLFFFS